MSSAIAGRLLLLAFAAAAFSSSTNAQRELRPLPPILRSVSDEVGALSQKQGDELSSALYDVLKRKNVRVVMVIAETTRPESIEDYAGRLARQWVLDRAIDPTRTIFVIVAVNDREMRITPGGALGLNSSTTADVTAGLEGYFRDGRIFDALMLLTARLRRVLEQGATSR